MAKVENIRCILQELRIIWQQCLHKLRLSQKTEHFRKGCNRMKKIWSEAELRFLEPKLQIIMHTSRLCQVCVSSKSAPVFTLCFWATRKAGCKVGWMQSRLDAKASFLKMNPPGQMDSHGQGSCHRLLHVLHSDCTACGPPHFPPQPRLPLAVLCLCFAYHRFFPNPDTTSSRTRAWKEALLDHLVLSLQFEDSSLAFRWSATFRAVMATGLWGLLNTKQLQEGTNEQIFYFIVCISHKTLTSHYLVPGPHSPSPPPPPSCILSIVRPGAVSRTSLVFFSSPPEANTVCFIG